MKKKSKQFVVGIVLCAIGVFGLFGLFVEQEDKASLAFGSLVFIAAGAIVLFLDYRHNTKNTNSEANNSANSDNETKTYTFHVAGVTFNNGRKTRQAILRKIKWGDPPFDSVKWTLDTYEYQDKPAVGVYANGEQVGNVPKDQLLFVLQRIVDDSIESISGNVVGGGKDSDGNALNFGCEVTLVLNQAQIKE